VVWSLMMTALSTVLSVMITEQGRVGNAVKDMSGVMVSSGMSGALL
jgi:hypothetical protein